MKKKHLVIVRKHPNFWEMKVIDGPEKADTWVAIQFSSAYSFADVQKLLGPTATVFNATEHYETDNLLPY